MTVLLCKHEEWRTDSIQRMLWIYMKKNLVFIPVVGRVWD